MPEPPKKKPRSAWPRFVYPAPNACWPLDATEYLLTLEQALVITDGNSITVTDLLSEIRIERTVPAAG